MRTSILSILVLVSLAALAFAGGFVTHVFRAYSTIPAGSPGAGVHEIPGLPPVRSFEVSLRYVYIPAEDRFEPYANVRVLGQNDGSPWQAQADDGHVLTFIAEQDR